MPATSTRWQCRHAFVPPRPGQTMPQLVVTHRLHRNYLQWRLQTRQEWESSLICYMMAKVSILFEKFPSLCEVEACHGVDIEFSYRNPPSATLFMHFIAQAQREHFSQALLSSSKFCSYLMDGSTDAGNVEQELVVLLLCKRDDTAEKIWSVTQYLSIASQKKNNKCRWPGQVPYSLTLTSWNYWSSWAP